ncbi:MAG: DegT/DnrJ/EryC1/StrS aminotransferase [Candidatus Daviesbacteria bacterium GW2011_GWA1_41_61]|uniref:DegT/DnrJ/EryC1/StrS aminotransferase n=1 Tax=Candidatus Daviesbacteria bacterium GW2011_GWA2_40_9 TaxID=1618424 RepID=A0A0G0U782_9BACT|nr:MAG: DegT/DnrJ/EryC1/StrS aminotransferase [Candidatus Daviesbacteria bacterium GW2011_GWC1_40_9]KKR83056.1 MAG: DegT/DnrJ/EryC1/StrS aminotransferase [Candidatus Daviesbacteria bacterium GW2011_GWA2_40_9]KKR92980.1 MAG: DegT/DnrJ/EryC1/StrS aminotransferase [Candidatus Daviesbacteria bacterium GW2011_GWB1_41_15]KKS15524.1 MAG: DegT/DnrJ/EryC1/StrS aminotransferase [Candidatus Daviesbacteria bacterium GW2011_GWA1_41_61]
MKRTIAFAKPFIDKKEITAVTKILRSGWLTMGEETIAFEKEFAEYVGAKWAVAVNSCTSALFLSLKALGVGRGDEVIVPSFTFAATANVIVHNGATPIFVDIKADDFTIDLKSVEKKLSKKTKAVIPIHYAGNLAQTDFQTKVLEDSAHRIAPKHRSENLVCYSFYATKNLTTAEGGMITTDDEEMAKWLVKARLHGLSHDAWKRYAPGGNWRYEVEFCGYKFNTIDLLAAMGRVQLQKLEGMEEKRKQIISRYNQLLGLKNQGTHLYPILVEQRDKFMAYIKAQGISCSFHFLPLHKSPAFVEYKTPSLPVTEYVGNRVVTLPLYPGLSLKEVETVCQKVKKFGQFNEGQFGLTVLT